jgi:hypothetical protein
MWSIRLWSGYMVLIGYRIFSIISTVKKHPFSLLWKQNQILRFLFCMFLSSEGIGTDYQGLQKTCLHWPLPSLRFQSSTTRKKGCSSEPTLQSFCYMPGTRRHNEIDKMRRDVKLCGYPKRFIGCL